MDSLYIDKVLSGDSHAFNYFISNYKDMAFSVSLSIVKNELLAEEATQEAFIQVYLSLRNFNSDSKFSTWFYKIVVRCSYKLISKKNLTHVEFDVKYHDVEIDETALDSLVIEEQKQLVNDVLMRMPSNESLALRLFYLQELSVQELCEITGWTVSNSKVILHRARKRMAYELNKVLDNVHYGRKQG